MEQASTRHNEQCSQREAELAEAIIAYLAEHPQAMDTLEGIAEWWLMRHRVRNELEMVARAIERLAAEGLIEKVGPDETCLYRLKQLSQTEPSQSSDIPNQ
jgi:hypothetical protein